MALECTSIAALQVTGSDYPDVNGIYYPLEDTLNQTQRGDIWVKNNINDLIRIVNPGGSSWSVAYRTGLGPTNAPLFYKDGATNCPQLGQYTVGFFGGGYTEPTVSEYVPAPSLPTFGLPAESVALITSRFGSVANFLRLRNLGQV